MLGKGRNEIEKRRGWSVERPHGEEGREALREKLCLGLSKITGKLCGGGTRGDTRVWDTIEADRERRGKRDGGRGEQLVDERKIDIGIVRKDAGGRGHRRGRRERGKGFKRVAEADGGGSDCRREI